MGTEEKSERLHLFDAYGIELEYMIVDDKTLNVKPITDKLIYSIAGSYLNEVDAGRISYSNELALHVVELKTTVPEPDLEPLGALFSEHICKLNRLLKRMNARLLPTGAHPWMDPHKEMQLWNHEYNPVYEAYHRIFDCRGHGWANLQSMHLNLPFGNDEEFFLLHSGIRMLLPLLPAIAASSPLMDGKIMPHKDARLNVYRRNQQKIPSIAGQVIPDVCRSQSHYEEVILAPIYKDIAPYDPANILQFEWLNSRGAIARFDRNAIEIRVLDIQECPRADIAIARAIVYVLQSLIHEKWAKKSRWLEFPTQPLVDLFLRAVEFGEEAVVDDPEYLAIFGLNKSLTANHLWIYLLSDFLKDTESAIYDVLLREGTLSTRILRALNGNDVLHIYGKLSECLTKNEPFMGIGVPCRCPSL